MKIKTKMNTTVQCKYSNEEAVVENRISYPYSLIHNKYIYLVCRKMEEKNRKGLQSSPILRGNGYRYFRSPRSFTRRTVSGTHTHTSAVEDLLSTYSRDSSRRHLLIGPLGLTT